MQIKHIPAYVLRWSRFTFAIIAHGEGIRGRLHLAGVLSRTIAAHWGWKVAPRTYQVRLDGRVFHVDAARGDITPFASIWIEKEYLPSDRFAIPVDGVVIDIGAHVGFFAVWACSAASGGHIYSFEPDPESSTRLESTIRGNNIQNVEIIRSAIAQSEGTVTFKKMGHSVDSRIAPDGQPGVEVACTTLDAFVKERGITRIDYLKLDAEFAELDVLRAAQVNALPLVQVAAIEIHRSDWLEPVDAIMREHGLCKEGQRNRLHYYARP